MCAQPPNISICTFHCSFLTVYFLFYTAHFSFHLSSFLLASHYSLLNGRHGSRVIAPSVTLSDDTRLNLCTSSTLFSWCVYSVHDATALALKLRPPYCSVITVHFSLLTVHCCLVSNFSLSTLCCSLHSTNFSFIYTPSPYCLFIIVYSSLLSPCCLLLHHPPHLIAHSLVLKLHFSLFAPP